MIEHMKKSNFEWVNFSYIVGYHLALVIGLPFFFMKHNPSWGIWIASAILYFVSGISVTAGYHRLYSHLAYKANKAVEVVLLFFATAATQGSALKWSCDHRRHHAFVDTDRDPYSINKGFWFAHVLWLFQKTEPIDPKVVADLYRNRLVMFQDKFYLPLMIITNLICVLFMGYLFNDYVGAFVIGWGVRLFFSHHTTWFINSLAHTWGSQPFSQEHSAVNNYVLSLVTFGEGYHNYHHTFAHDYRNGTRWYHFDPTKWVIWTMHKLRLATGLRRVNTIQIKERIVIEHKKELLATMREFLSTNTTLIEEKIEKVTNELLTQYSQLNQLIKEYQIRKKEKSVDKTLLKSLSLEIRALKKRLKSTWKDWKKTSKEVSFIFETDSSSSLA
jgi:stearoyl-CoA desaturase (delta-9 desaturase)